MKLLLVPVALTLAVIAPQPSDGGGGPHCYLSMAHTVVCSGVHLDPAPLPALVSDTDGLPMFMRIAFDY